jgi:hypothetical protein
MIKVVACGVGFQQLSLLLLAGYFLWLYSLCLSYLPSSTPSLPDAIARRREVSLLK